MSHDMLRELADRAGIEDVINRYASAIDLRDWTLLRTCFTDQVTADFRSFGVREVFKGGADDWVGAVRATIEGLDATQHFFANKSYRIEGDRARCTVYMQAAHFLANDLGDAEYTVGGHYENDLERTADGWRTRAYVLHVTFHRGNRHVLRLAARKAKQSSRGPGPSRDAQL